MAEEPPTTMDPQSGALDAEGEGAIKVILLGDSAVGKSKLVERFLMNDYQPRQVGPL